MEKKEKTSKLEKLLKKRKYNNQELGQLLIYAFMEQLQPTPGIDIDKLYNKYRVAETEAIRNNTLDDTFRTYRALHVGISSTLNYMMCYQYRFLYFHYIITTPLVMLKNFKREADTDIREWDTLNIPRLIEMTKHTMRYILAYNKTLEILEEAYGVEGLSIKFKHRNTDKNLDLLEEYNDLLDMLSKSDWNKGKGILKEYTPIDIKELYPKKENIELCKQTIKEIGLTDGQIKYLYNMLSIIGVTAGDEKNL